MSQSRFDTHSRLRGILLVATAAALLVGLGQGDARAQHAHGDYTPPRPPANPLKIRQHHKEGEYGGVTPGLVYRYGFELEKKADKRVQRLVKRRTNRRARRRLTVSWVGFQPRPGGASRVFIQLNREAVYTQRVDKNVLVVTVEGARHGSRNARRRIETRYFDTSIMLISSKRVRRRRAHKGRPAQSGGVAFYIQFKNPSDARQAQARLGKLEDGYYYLNLDFGPATSGTSSPGSSDPK